MFWLGCVVTPSWILLFKITPVGHARHRHYKRIEGASLDEFSQTLVIDFSQEDVEKAREKIYYIV